MFGYSKLSDQRKTDSSLLPLHLNCSSKIKTLVEPSAKSALISCFKALVWLGMLCWLIHLGLVVMRFFKHSDFPSYFYESLPPQLPRKPSEVRNFVTTLQGTTILHSNSVPAAERTGANSHSRRLSLESTQLGSGYSLPFSSATSDASSGFDSGRRTFSFPPSRNSDRRMNETYEDLCTPPGEKTPIKVTLIDYGSTAVIRESGQKTSQF